MGPPTTKRPVGLTYTVAARHGMPASSITGAMTCSSMSALMVPMSSISGACWVEMTMVSTATGRSSS